MIGANHEYVATDWNMALNRGPVGVRQSLPQGMPGADLAKPIMAGAQLLGNRLSGGGGGGGRVYASVMPQVIRGAELGQGKPE